KGFRLPDKTQQMGVVRGVQLLSEFHPGDKSVLERGAPLDFSLHRLGPLLSLKQKVKPDGVGLARNHFDLRVHFQPAPADSPDVGLLELIIRKDHFRNRFNTDPCKLPLLHHLFDLLSEGNGPSKEFSPFISPAHQTFFDKGPARSLPASRSR